MRESNSKQGQGNEKHVVDIKTSKHGTIPQVSTDDRSSSKGLLSSVAHIRSRNPADARKPDDYSAEKNVEEIIVSKQTVGAIMGESPSVGKKGKFMAHHLTTEVYAFTAELKEDTTIASDATVVFSNVLSNYGGLYFNESGQFACVDGGVYTFLWSTTNAKGNTQRNALKLRMAGGTLKQGPKTSAHASEAGGCSSMLAVVRCSTDTPTAVTVMTDVPPVSYAAPYTTFTGFRLGDPASTIAFTAEVSQDVNIFPGQRIIFDRSLQNVGNGYNPLSGFFRCPDNEVYVFFVSIQNPSTNWSTSTLMMNGETVIHGPMTYVAKSNIDSGSSSLLTTLQCQQGLDVYVNAKQTHTFQFNSYGSVLSSFSGFRLRAPSRPVAFTAVLSANHTAVALNRTVVFGQLITDTTNGAYNPINGTFSCPDNSVYFFSWTGASNIGGGGLDLYMGGIIVKSNVFTPQTQGASSGTSGTSTMSVVLPCQPFRHINIATSASSVDGTIYLAQYTSFTGFAIPRD